MLFDVSTETKTASASLYLTGTSLPLLRGLEQSTKLFFVMSFASRHTDDSISVEIEKDLAELEELDDEEESEEEEDENLEEGDARVRSIQIMEERLAQQMSELTRIRHERAKQRSQLDQLAVEHENLKTQQDSRIERTKLQEQVQELQDSVEATLLLKQMAREEFEQTRTHHRQLQKTLKLLQGGVEFILEQSSNDPSTYPVGVYRRKERQALLKEILEDDWNKSKLFESDEEVELDDLKPEDESPHTRHMEMIRYDSLDSMMSEIASIDTRDILLPESHSRKERVQQAAHDLTSSVHRQGRRSAARSKHDSKEEQEARLRSHSLSSHRTSGQSTTASSRRGGTKGQFHRGVARAKSLTSSETSGNRALHGGGLRTMLETYNTADNDADSQDTPRTNNTPKTK